MRTSQLFRSFLFLIFISAPSFGFSQTAETIAEAKSNYEQALQAFANRQYETAIEKCLISISEVPTPKTYYVLTSAYAKNGMPKSALTYANITLQIKPPLTGVYRDKTVSIQQWALSELQKSSTPAPAPEPAEETDHEVALTGEALTGTGPNFVIPAPPANEDAFAEQENAPSPPGSTFKSTTILNTAQGQHNIDVYDNNNNKVGEINFYGFTGGQTNGTALTFSLPVKAITGMNQINDPMAQNTIVFTANELNVGAVKSRIAGMLTFKATILAANKSGTDRYYMQSVKVVVNAYPTPMMKARILN